MAWVASVVLDDDKDDVGTATAIWNEGLADEFAYSRRAEVTGAEANAFVAEAVVARDARDTKLAQAAPLTAALQGKFDALP